MGDRLTHSACTSHLVTRLHATLQSRTAVVAIARALDVESQMFLLRVRSNADGNRSSTQILAYRLSSNREAARAARVYVRVGYRLPVASCPWGNIATTAAEAGGNNVSLSPLRRGVYKAHIHTSNELNTYQLLPGTRRAGFRTAVCTWYGLIRCETDAAVGSKGAVGMQMFAGVPLPACSLHKNIKSTRCC